MHIPRYLPLLQSSRLHRLRFLQRWHLLQVQLLYLERLRRVQLVHHQSPLVAQTLVSRLQLQRVQLVRARLDRLKHHRVTHILDTIRLVGAPPRTRQLLTR